MDWFWPRIDSRKEAQHAALIASLWASFIACVTTALSLLSIFVGHRVLGTSGFSLIDAFLFAVIAWRTFKLSFVWACFGVVLEFAELAWKVNENRYVGVLGIVIFLGFVAGVRGCLYLRKENKLHSKARPTQGAPSQQHPATPISASDPANSSAPPLWLGELTDWIELRLQDQALPFRKSERYRRHIYQGVQAARRAVLTEAQFSDMCKVTAASLMFRTQILIVGMKHNADVASILGVMCSVLPEYPAYHKFEDVVGDVISLKDFGKMQLFEAEMYSVIRTYLSKEVGWFTLMSADMQQAAEQYWQTRALPSSMEIRRSDNPTSATASPS